MKKPNIILLFLMVLACLAACHKDKEMDVKEAVVSNEEMTVSETQARFSWQVEFAGQFQTGVEVSQNENMADLRRVEASKEEDRFVAVVDSLTEGKKYYYRIVVWNKFGSYEETVKDFTTAKTFSIHVEASEGGTAAGGGTFAEGDTCTVVATANVGYNFVNWTENESQVSAEAEYSFAVTGNRSLVANFTSQEYTITATAEPEEGGTVNGSGGYNNGDECTLRATANEGYEFLNWTKEDGSIVSTDPVYAFTVTETAAFVAHFQIKSYTITILANPDNGGTVDGGGTYEYGQSCTVHATEANSYHFVNWTENGGQVSSSAEYAFIVTGDRDLVANFIYNGGSGAEEYVDLGLPSGLLWATCNVGANAPEQYGYYFAWGEIEHDKDIYNWNTYQHCNGSYNTLTKYSNNSSYGYNGFTDFLTILEPSDDAATAIWGNNWRIPTLEEWQELLNNTTHIWTTQNGVNGRLFTATNGNNLFMPAAGCSYESSIGSLGSSGYYWSSSLSMSNPSDAWYLGFYSDECGMYNCNRYYGLSVRAVYSSVQSYTIDVSSNPSVGGSVIGGGSYTFGSSCTVIARANSNYSFTNWTEGGNVISTQANYTFTVNSNRTLVANFTYNGGGSAPQGAIDGKFTINSSVDKVYFSKGNLQYIGSSQTWKFADNQWEVIGTSQGNSSQTTTRDLFGWGTSGFNHGAVCYQPWSTSQTYSDYYAYGGYQYNLYDQTGQANWGYNPISNGGDQAGQWRTLTGGRDGEWNYIFNQRNASTVNGKPNARYAKATVNSVAGVVLFPDEYTHPSAAAAPAYESINVSGASFTSNNWSGSAWTAMEYAGCVFLPAAGYRNGASVDAVGSRGYYWSASYFTDDLAFIVYFIGSNLDPQISSDRYYGFSVRLVRVAQ